MNASTGRIAAAPPGQRSKRAKVLVIDADRSSRCTCKAILERHGYRVDEVADAGGALRNSDEPLATIGLVAASALAPEFDSSLHGIGWGQTPRPALLLVCDSELVPEHDVACGEVLTRSVRPAELAYRVRSLLRLHDLQQELHESTTARKEQTRIPNALPGRSVWHRLQSCLENRRVANWIGGRPVGGE